MDDRKMESREEILKRLRRIEGQVKGIQKMVEEDKSCTEILTQVAAVRAAINKAGGLILEKHSRTCLENAVTSDNREQALKELTRTMQSFMRFVE